MIDIKKAAKLWKEGMSQSNIGKQFGMTKGQIAGIFSRNRDVFPKRSDKIDSLEAKIRDALFASIEEDKKSARVTSNAVRKIFHEALNPPKHKEIDGKEYDISRMEYAVTFADLDEKRCCKWPVTNNPSGVSNLFCAAVKTGRNYCQAHEGRQWRVM